jgi:hypothetical protein
MGQDNQAKGTYKLMGGTLVALKDEFIGFRNGSGTFDQTGGSNTVSGNLYLSDAVNNSNATYLLKGGSLSVDGTIILKGGGHFEQTGGTLDFGAFNQINGVARFHDLYLGRNTGSSSTYSLSAGSLTVTGTEFIGANGSGAFTQSGGTHTVNELVVDSGRGSSTYALQNGTLMAGKILVGSSSSTLTQTGGILAITGDTAGGAFPLNLNGGTLQASGGAHTPSQCKPVSGRGPLTKPSLAMLTSSPPSR